MKVISSIESFRTWRRTLADELGLVPTMGYLHAGHLSLVRAARQQNTHTAATIFVNPTQFAANEDLTAYPRNLERDLAMLEEAGVDAVFTPAADSIYPAAFQTYVTVEEVSKGNEGARRPGHFRGVATVVAKLFNITQPQRAYFGQKDAQQVVVLRRMTADLNFPVEIVVCPIVREPDGLAMSSRNVYLTPEERQAASVISRALLTASVLYDAGARHPDELRQAVQNIVAAEPLAQLDYVSVANASDLAEVTTPTNSPLLLSTTVRIGKPRLLDNLLLPAHLNTQEGATSVLGAV
jgi:pantoate--beta-alanine ligase